MHIATQRRLKRGNQKHRCSPVVKARSSERPAAKHPRNTPITTNCHPWQASDWKDKPDGTRERQRIKRKGRGWGVTGSKIGYSTSKIAGFSANPGLMHKDNAYVSPAPTHLPTAPGITLNVTSDPLSARRPVALGNPLPSDSFRFLGTTNQPFHRVHGPSTYLVPRLRIPTSHRSMPLFTASVHRTSVTMFLAALAMVVTGQDSQVPRQHAAAHPFISEVHTGREHYPDQDRAKADVENHASCSNWDACVLVSHSQSA